MFSLLLGSVPPLPCPPYAPPLAADGASSSGLVVQKTVGSIFTNVPAVAAFLAFLAAQFMKVGGGGGHVPGGMSHRTLPLPLASDSPQRMPRAASRKRSSSSQTRSAKPGGLWRIVGTWREGELGFIAVRQSGPAYCPSVAVHAEGGGAAPPPRAPPPLYLNSLHLPRPPSPGPPGIYPTY